MRSDLEEPYEGQFGDDFVNQRRESSAHKEAVHHGHRKVLHRVVPSYRVLQEDVEIANGHLYVDYLDRDAQWDSQQNVRKKAPPIVPTLLKIAVGGCRK